MAMFASSCYPTAVYLGLFCSVLFAIVSSTLADEPGTGRLVDLTHSFGENTLYWPTEDGFRLERGPAGVTERGYFYSANRFSAAEHGGTHIDAPIHFFEGQQTVDQIPLERLIGPGVCVDVSRQCAANRDYQVAAEDFQEWERTHDASLADCIVLISTGFARHWPDRAKYLGTAETGRAAVAKLQFPGPDPSAADWLIRRRRVRMVGIDTASIDHGQSQDFPTHVRLARDNIPVLENLANLDQLPPTGFTVMALPMKIAEGTGAPCRVVAVVAE